MTHINGDKTQIASLPGRPIFFAGGFPKAHPSAFQGLECQNRAACGNEPPEAGEDIRCSLGESILI